MTAQDGSYHFAPGSQKFIKFSFDLSDDWNGLTVFAQWIQGDTAYNSYLDSNNCAYLPPEIVPGQCIMMLYGTGGSNIIGTTMPLKFQISEDYFEADAQSTVITQSLYDQLVARITDCLLHSDVATVQETKQYLNIT